MIIRFDNMEKTVLQNFKGGEKELTANMFFDGTNRILKGILAPGASIGVHTHEDSCEMIFIISGTGTIMEKSPEDNEATYSTVQQGDCLYCPKNHTHSLINTAKEGDLVFYAAVPRQ